MSSVPGRLYGAAIHGTYCHRMYGAERSERWCTHANENKPKVIRGGNIKAVCVIARDGRCPKVNLPRPEHLLVNYFFLSPLKWPSKIKYSSLIITSTTIREEQ